MRQRKSAWGCSLLFGHAKCTAMLKVEQAHGQADMPSCRMARCHISYPGEAWIWVGEMVAACAAAAASFTGDLCCAVLCRGVRHPGSKADNCSQFWEVMLHWCLQRQRQVSQGLLVFACNRSVQSLLGWLTCISIVSPTAFETQPHCISTWSGCCIGVLTDSPSHCHPCTVPGIVVCALAYLLAYAAAADLPHAA